MLAGNGGQLAVLPVQHRETDYSEAATDFDFSDENYELVSFLIALLSA
jgi:hypothetical protein